MRELLILVALVGMGFGLLNIFRPSGRWHVDTRRKGAAVLGVSFLVAVIGVGTGGADDAPETRTAASSSTTMASTTTMATTASAHGVSTTTVPLPDLPQAGDLFRPPAAGASGDPAAPFPQGSTAMTVLGITDGDTLDVKLDGGASDTVRLIGVNSPESGECFSAEAALVLEALVPVGSEIGATIDVSDRDRFDRLLRYLWVGGLSINEELVRRGAAIGRRYPPDTAMAEHLEAAQEEARSAGLGMWRRDACGPEAGTEITVLAIEADSPGDDNLSLDEELVRIGNGGALEVDMSGWVLKDESATNRYEFPADFVLGAGTVVAIYTGCGADRPGSLYWCNDGAVWNNDGDTAFVLDHQGNIVDSLAYVPPTTTTVAPSTTVEAGVASGDCHPSYTGTCVPIVSDVDCFGGSGNGPEYVGRVTVIGPDDYDLDRDGDGVGCE